MSKKYQLFYLDKVFFQTDEHELMYMFMNAAAAINHEDFVGMSFYVDGVIAAKTLFIWEAEKIYTSEKEARDFIKVLLGK